MTELSIDKAREVGGYVAARAQIRDVRAHLLHAELITPPTDADSLSYYLQPSVSSTFDEDGPAIIIEAAYELNIRQLAPREGADELLEDEAEEFVEVAKVDVTVAGLFLLDLDEDDRIPSANEVDAYARSTGRFALHPYAREHIASLTTRIGLPTLTVGVLRMGTGEIAED
jgi:hypothetical protein